MAPSREDVISVSVPSWYPLFKKHTIKTRIITLPQKFIEFLLEDGVVLPASVNTTKRQVRTEIIDVEDTIWSDDDEDDAKDAGAEPFFPDLVKSMDAAIKELGGAVFPKLNWNSPSDAMWMTCGQTMRCRKTGDVLLLLKSSDRIVNDLEKPFARCGETPSWANNDTNDHTTININDVSSNDADNDVKSSSNSSSSNGSSDNDSDSNSNSNSNSNSKDHEQTLNCSVVLRQWSHLHPGNEFRCFVRANTLIAACQRNKSYMEHLNNDQSKFLIEESIINFFLDIVAPSFPLTSYVFDVYIDRNNKVWLLDFDLFHKETDAILFTWPELQMDDISKWSTTHSADAGLDTETPDDADDNIDKHENESEREEKSIPPPSSSSSSSSSPSPPLAAISETSSSSSSSSSSTSSSSTSSSSTDAPRDPSVDDSFLMRVITSRQAGEMHVPFAVPKIVQRLPQDDIDLSDAVAIESFVARAQAMNLFQSADSDSESDDDDDDDDDDNNDNGGDGGANALKTNDGEDDDMPDLGMD